MNGDATPARPRPATIRRAEERDYAAVRALYARLQNTHASNQPQVFVPADENELGRFDFHLAIEAADMIVLVAERDGDIVAAAQASLTCPSAEMRARRVVYVTHLFTEEQARRQGHARALMRAIAAWARLKDATAIHLWVWEGNAEADGFYRALGCRAMATLHACPLLGT